MPIREFEFTGPPIQEADIDALEETRGFKLPDDYRAFLLRTNGGRPYPEDVFGYGLTGSVMNMFYAVKYDNKSFTIAQRHFAFDQRIPPDLLPIGNDAGGNQICLGIGPDNHGKVFLWLMHDEEDAPTYRNVRLMAESFTEFLKTFRDPPDEELFGPAS